VTILDPGSEIISVFRVLEESFKKITMYDTIDFIILIKFSNMIIDIARTKYVKEFDEYSKCDVYYSEGSGSERFDRVVKVAKVQPA